MTNERCWFKGCGHLAFRKEEFTSYTFLFWGVGGTAALLAVARDRKSGKDTYVGKLVTGVGVMLKLLQTSERLRSNSDRLYFYAMSFFQQVIQLSSVTS